MRNWEKGNPMKSREAVNVSTGHHTSGKTGRHSSPKMGAGRVLGPPIAKGYLISGTGTTMPTGGKFRSAATAKRSKGSKKGRG